MGYIKGFRYDGFMLLQCIALFIKSMFFLQCVSKIAVRNNDLSFWETIRAFPLHLPLYLAVLSLIFLTKRKWTAALLFNTALSLLIFMDLIYFRAFGLPTSWFSLSGIMNLGEVGNSVAGLIHVSDLLLFVDVFFWAAMLMMFRRREGWITPIRWTKFGVYLSMSCVMGYVEYSQNDLLEKILAFRYKPLYAIEKIGPIGYHLADSVNYVKDYSSATVSIENRKEIKDWFIENQRNHTTVASPSHYEAKFKNKNVIFIHFESLENFPLRKKWNQVEITPNLNRLLDHSLYFSNIKEQVGEGNSADAEFIMFNSLYPLAQGIVSLRYPADHFYSFPRELQDHGYETAAFVGMEKAFMNMGVMLPKYGFKQIYPISSFKFKEKIGLGLGDGEMFPQVLDKLRSLPKPFFGYIITLTNHVPYYLPSNLQVKELSEGIENARVRSYLQTVHYTDKALGEFIKGMAKSGLDKDTVLVIYGDHEGINKYYSKDVENSGMPWVKNNKTVPFIVYHPSLNGKEIKQLGGQVDILPTVEHLLGIPTNQQMLYRVGRDLLSTQDGFALLHNGEYLSTNTKQHLKDFRSKGLEMSQKVLQADLFGK